MSVRLVHDTYIGSRLWHMSITNGHICIPRDCFIPRLDQTQFVPRTDRLVHYEASPPTVLQANPSTDFHIITLGKERPVRFHNFTYVSSLSRKRLYYTDLCDIWTSHRTLSSSRSSLNPGPWACCGCNQDG